MFIKFAHFSLSDYKAPHRGHPQHSRGKSQKTDKQDHQQSRRPALAVQHISQNRLVAVLLYAVYFSSGKIVVELISVKSCRKHQDIGRHGADHYHAPESGAFYIEHLSQLRNASEIANLRHCYKLWKPGKEPYQQRSQSRQSHLPVGEIQLREKHCAEVPAYLMSGLLEALEYGEVIMCIRSHKIAHFGHLDALHVLLRVESAEGVGKIYQERVKRQPGVCIAVVSGGVVIYIDSAVPLFGIYIMKVGGRHTAFKTEKRLGRIDRPAETAYLIIIFHLGAAYVIGGLPGASHLMESRIDAAGLLFIAVLVIGSTAVGTDDHIVLLGKLFTAHNASCTNMIEQFPYSFRKRGYLADF